MRWFYMAIICVFAAAVITFASQNLKMVSMSFLCFSARVPLAPWLRASMCWAL